MKLIFKYIREFKGVKSGNRHSNSRGDGGIKHEKWSEGFGPFNKTFKSTVSE